MPHFLFNKLFPKLKPAIKIGLGKPLFKCFGDILKLPKGERILRVGKTMALTPMKAKTVQI